MKNLSLVLGLGLLLSAVQGTAFAQSSVVEDHMSTAPQWEVSGNANISYHHTTFEGDSGAREFDVGAKVGYFVLPALEVTFAPALSTFNQGNQTTSTLQLLVGPTFNFLGNAENAFFVEGLVGTTLSYNGPQYPNYGQFTYQFGLGKRFQLFKNVTFKPEVNYQHLVSRDLTTDAGQFLRVGSTNNWNFIPFQFSILF